MTPLHDILVRHDRGRLAEWIRDHGTPDASALSAWIIDTLLLDPSISPEDAVRWVEELVAP